MACSLSVYGQHEIILDDSDARMVGSWEQVSDPAANGGSYLLHKATTNKKTNALLVWTPDIAVHGIYALYGSNPKQQDRLVKHATFQVQYADGIQDYTMDQQREAGKWTFLGINEWTAGKNGTVELQDVGDTDDTELFVAGDAIRLLQVGEIVSHPDRQDANDPLSVRWQPHSLWPGSYAVYYRLPANRDLVGRDLAFAVRDDRGTHEVNVRVGAALGDWLYLGEFSFQHAEATYVEVTGKNADVTKGGKVKYIIPQVSGYQLADRAAQTILGLGVEIQSDGFGPNYTNDDPAIGVPHELVPEERERLSKEMLKGFRYLRLAMGLWFRGQTPDGKNIVERYPGQVDGLSRMMADAGIEGTSVEYWSPPIYWKDNGRLQRGGSIKSLDTGFLSEFGDALVKDLDYLTTNGIPVSMWGLQNEPAFNQGYPSMVYTNEAYYETFKVVAPKIRAAYPDVMIVNESQYGQEGRGSELIKKDPAVLPYVDAWTWHRIGKNANDQIDNQTRFNRGLEGRPVFNNEFEYFLEQVDRYPEDWRMVNTAQSIMNWFTFENSPSWFWLHALKPIRDRALYGFALGVFRPWADDDYSRFPHLEKGHFEYLWSNWYAMAGFLKHLPWNSVRYEVDEEVTRYDQRIMCWKTPDGKYTFALTNRSSEDFTFQVSALRPGNYSGYRYDKDGMDQGAGTVSGSGFSIRLKPMSIEFWTEQ